MPRLSQLPWSTWHLSLSLVTFYCLLWLHSGPRPDALLSTLAWFGTTLFFLLCCWQLDQEVAQTELRQPLTPLFITAWSRVDTLALLAFLSIGFILRFTALDHMPLAMHNDEGAMAMEAVQVTLGNLSDPFAVGWTSHPTLWFYLLAASLRVFGETLFAVRLVAVLVGTFTIASAYLLGRLLFTRRVALLATALLATYHFHIHFSRIGLNNIADPALGTLIFCALTLALRTRRSLWFGVTGLLLGLALYFYFGARLFLLVLPALGVTWWLTHPRQWHQQWAYLRQPATWSNLCLLLAGFCFVAAPLLQTFYHSPNAFLHHTNVATLSPAWVAQVTTEKGWSVAHFFAMQLKSVAQILTTHGDTSDFYDKMNPLVGGAAAWLMGLGLLLSLWHIRQWPYQLLLVWSGLALLLGGVLMRSPLSSQRYLTLAPVICLLIALALAQLADWAQGFRLLAARVKSSPPSLRWQSFTLNFILSVVVAYLAATSVYQYFWNYIPRETFGNWSSQAATMLAQELQLAPAGTKLWFLSNYLVSYHGFPILPFLARQVQGRDLPDALENKGDLPAVDSRIPTLFAAVPERLAELQMVQKYYPGGQLRPLYWPKRLKPILYLYLLNYNVKDIVIPFRNF